MLEGEGQVGNTMERKNMSGPPCRGSGLDSKKDNGNNAYRNQRQSKRRETSTRPSYDQSAPRKPMPQKSRALDKRPRARGYNKDTEEEEMTKMKELEPEFGSVQAWGSKKSNMSHLLNFHFEQRDMQKGSGGSGRGQTYTSWRGNRKRWENKSMPYNKERFLQANCQFVVCESGDYSVHYANPDMLVDWSFIEQVRILSTEVPSCPICLYPPTAAKITRCGHIYCWTCILHYLSLGEKTWRKCPICYESVHEKDLKSVRSLETKKFKAGDTIEMQLMKREKGTITVIPIDKWQHRDSLFNIDDDNLCTCYSKLLMASPAQVEQIITMERSELEAQLAEEEEGQDSLEVSYIKAALEAVRKRQVDLSPTLQAQEEVSSVLENLELQDTAAKGDEGPRYHHNEDAVQYADAFDNVTRHEPPKPPSDEEAEQIGHIPACDSSVSLASAVSFSSEAEDPEPGEPTPQSPGVPLDGITSPLNLDVDFPVEVEEEKPVAGASASRCTINAFYFYQANDGQQIYMNSLNARCLVKEYGSLELCPPTITAKIVDMEMVSMNEDLRRRLRYLSHLPLTCEFQVAELDLQPPIMSPETLMYFNDEFERRKKMRLRKIRDDKRRSKKIQLEENKKFGIDPTVKIVRSCQSAPDFGKLTHEPAPIPAALTIESTESTPVGSPMEFTVGSPVSVGSSDDGQLSTPSFAQMLKAGKTRAPEVRPKVDKTAGDTEVASGRKDSEGSDSEDRVPVPTYQTSFGNAIQAALDSYSKGDDVVTSICVPTAVQDHGAGKKKKKQKKLLFTTTMARSK